ncbi:alpha-1-acid glycoprotein-like [Choloepus didactylus]|uniref:alpha-1-acid glycoprotein-like n=1 Tax=Choloepus didactylus TaxID=27675 RepID=UPI00189CC44C|nr:alpha-1-acid glycoprotein-like [Choloepus didactylus]
MVLPWALAALSLLPLLTTQDPTCPYLKAEPITNATLERLSGRWFFIAVALRNPEYLQTTRVVEASFFYIAPNLTEDTLLFRQPQPCLASHLDLPASSPRPLPPPAARKQEVTREQLSEFQEALKCVGLQDDEILYTDGKKDLCGPLEKQHAEERKKGNTES